MRGACNIGERFFAVRDKFCGDLGQRGMPIMGIGQAMVDIVLGTGQFEGMASEGSGRQLHDRRISGCSQEVCG